MARVRIVYSHDGEPVAEYRNGDLIWSKEARDSRDAGFYVMPDIAPYQSMADGSMITSRSHHREHLKRHSLIEVGDQTHCLKPYGQYKPPPGRKEAIIRAVHEAKDRARR